MTKSLVKAAAGNTEGEKEAMLLLFDMSGAWVQTIVDAPKVVVENWLARGSGWDVDIVESG